MRNGHTDILDWLLYGLMLDCLVEMGSIALTVQSLRTDGALTVVTDENITVSLLTKPLHMSVNQGHVSNAAAGTALVFIGILGTFLMIKMRRQVGREVRQFTTSSKAFRTQNLLVFAVPFGKNLS